MSELDYARESETTQPESCYICGAFDGHYSTCSLYARLQPAPDAGEWRVDYSLSTGVCINDSIGCVAHVFRDKETAAQIVAEHNAVPRLRLAIDTLQIVQRLLINQQACEQSLCASCNEARQTVLDSVDTTLTTLRKGA